MTTQAFFRAERLAREGDLSAAVDAFRGLLEESPDHVAAWRSISGLLAQLGETQQSEDAKHRADVIEAEHITDVGKSLLFHGDYKRAESFFTRALAINEDCLNAHWLLGECHSHGGSRDTALMHYARCLEIEPDHQGPAFMIAALGEGESPGRAPDDYVSSFFDWYAEHFDDHLTKNLKYVGPGRVAAALREARPQGVARALDLGCGTGLAGVATKGLAEHLIGVDLSSEMLKLAANTGVYEKLVEADLGAAIRDLPDNSIDAAFAADVLVYIGALEDLFAGLARVLTSEGVFVATFETKSVDEGWELSESGRYRHSDSYLQQVSAKFGLGQYTMSDLVLREEYGEPVNSMIVTFGRSA